MRRTFFAVSGVTGLLLRYASELQCGILTGNEIDNEIVRSPQSP